MSRRGGYAILDFSGAIFDLPTPGDSDTHIIKNATAIAKQTNKPVIFSGIRYKDDSDEIITVKTTYVQSVSDSSYFVPFYPDNSVGLRVTINPGDSVTIVLVVD